MINDLTEYSPQHIVMRRLLQFFPDAVYENALPLPDTHVTFKDYSLVVTFVVARKVAEACHSESLNRVLDIAIYERAECRNVGALALIEQFLKHWLQDIVGDYPTLRIASVSYDSARDLPYIRDDFRARLVTFNVQVEVT